jgi:hypothetical protein
VLKKDIGATPRSQKAVTADDEWIGEVFGRESGKSTEDLLEERDTLHDEQQNENAACGNCITLGNIHGDDEKTEEGRKMRMFWRRNFKDLKAQSTAVRRAEGNRLPNSMRRFEVQLTIFHTKEGVSHGVRDMTHKNSCARSNSIPKTWATSKRQGRRLSPAACYELQRGLKTTKWKEDWYTTRLTSEANESGEKKKMKQKERRNEAPISSIVPSSLSACQALSVPAKLY